MYDSQKISQLRKEGQLTEALTLAREAIVREPDNEWNRRAAGWVLYDLGKKALQVKDYQAAQLHLSEFEALALPPEDEIINQQMSRLRGKLVTQSVAKPRNPQALVQYYEQLANQYPDNGLNIGWDLYRDLKEQNAVEQVPTEITLKFLDIYSRLQIGKPSKLHSVMLKLALDLVDNPAKRLEFIKWWELENLRPEDFERWTQGERTYDSLAEKVAVAVSNSIEKQRCSEDIELIMPLLERLGKQYPDNIWLRYHQGKLLLLSDQTDAAVALLIPVVRAKMSEPWAWGLLADIYSDDPTLELACLCRALQTKQEEQFLVKIRLRLAVILANLQNFSAAKYETDIVKAVYEANQWKLSEELVNLLNAPWYADTQSAADNIKLYRTHAPQAEALVLADLPSINGVISRQQSERDGKPGRSFISYKDGKIMTSIPAKHKQFRWLKKTPLGTPVVLKVAEESARSYVLTLERRQGDPWDLFAPFTGRFQAVKTFGFVQDDATGYKIFVPPQLVKDHHLVDGQMLTGRAEYSKDSKTKQLGWRSVFIAM